KIAIDASERQSRKLIEAVGVQIGFPEKTLLKEVSIKVSPGQRWGILGDNGSGKTTLLRTLIGELKPLSGSVEWAEQIKTVYFDQARRQLPDEQTIMGFIGEGSDHVIFRGKSLQAAAYVSRFGFGSEKMNLKIAQLSG